MEIEGLKEERSGNDEQCKNKRHLCIAVIRNKRGLKMQAGVQDGCNNLCALFRARHSDVKEICVLSGKGAEGVQQAVSILVGLRSVSGRG